MLKTLLVHVRPATAVAYLKAGKRIVSGGADTVRIWDAATGNLAETLDFGHQVTHVVVSPNGRSIAAAGRDLRNGFSKVWRHDR